MNPTARIMDQLRQDLGYAWRGLGCNVGFTVAALATLALGIGASTAMFSVVQSVLLRPLPYPEPDRLVVVSSELDGRGTPLAPSGYANIEDWRQASRTLSGLAAWDGVTTVIEDPSGLARRVSGVHASPNLFEVLGVRPELGRVFTAEDAAQRAPVVVISHAFWVEHFGRDRAVLGRTLIVNRRPLQVIGVMPAAFPYPDRRAALWLSETLAPGWDAARLNRGTDMWRTVARLAPGVSLEAAQRELAAIGARLERDFPVANAGLGVRVDPVSLQLAGRPLRLALFTLVGAVTAVLLIACSNVANLLLARTASRQRELALREALGARRGRIVAQLLLEGIVLALVAAAMGAGFAATALRLLRAFGPAHLPRFEDISLDATALGFAVCLACSCAVLFGLLPALRSTRRDPIEMLRGSGRGISDSRGARRLRAALVVTEFGLAIVLLAAAGLLGRSFARILAVDTGFQAGQALVVGVSLPRDRPATEAAPFAARVIDRVSALAGVRAIGVCEDVLLGEPNPQSLEVDGPPRDPGARLRLPLSLDAVSPGFFRAAGVALRSGRWFTAADNAQAAPVIIINETLARTLWPGADAVGRRLRFGGASAAWLTVVGVVADLRRQGADRPAIAQAFQPNTQRASRAMEFVIATTDDPVSLAPVVRRAIAEIDPGVPVSSATTLAELLDRRLAAREFTLGLIGAFAVTAVVLAGIGIFGLMNYAVARRTPEIGVRMALGARPHDVVRMIVGDGLRLAGGGIAVGLGLGALLVPIISSLLFEVGAADPIALAGSIAVLLAIAALACYLPARRAVRVNPVNALRAE